MTIVTPYEDTLRKIIENGDHRSDRTGTGTTSLFGLQMRFDIRESFPLITTKKMFTRGMIEELLWFINGDTNEHTLRDKNVHFWNSWAREDGELGPIYGKQFRSVRSYHVAEPVVYGDSADKKNINPGDYNEYDPHVDILRDSWQIILNDNDEICSEWADFNVFSEDAKKLSGWVNKLEYPDEYVLDCNTKMNSNQHNKDSSIWVTRSVSNKNWENKKNGSNLRLNEVDQLKELIASLKHNPDSRRHIISLWNPAEVGLAELPPCHGNIIQFYVNGEELSCKMYQRSADMFLGVPVNIASYSLFTYMIAQQVGLKPGEFIWTGGDCHIYDNHRDQVELQLSREPREYPVLRLDKADDIFSYQLNDVVVENYDPHPLIKGDVAV